MIKNISILISLSLFFISCNNECKVIDKNFRPHKVRHVNKSKVYYYYHNNPCDCDGLIIDLCLNCYYQKTYKNYIQYYDNKEILYGK